MTKIILASKSERRQELLRGLGIDIQILAPDVDENVPPSLAPADTVRELAARKLSAALCRAAGCDKTNHTAAYANQTGQDTRRIVIAADTVVSYGTEIFGKPTDRADAYRMLRRMSGQWHEVHTGLALSDGVRLTVESELTRVKFRELDDEEIYYYIERYRTSDKAGAYGIQDYAALFVERIEGDYFNIVGLPLARLAVILKRDFGVSVAALARDKSF